MAQTPREDITGVILAGGQSRRMQVDKATLNWRTNEGEVISWLAHARQRLLGVCATALVSGHPTHSDVPDAQTTPQGPLAGIAASLAHCRGQRCLFLPVDMPWVPSVLLQALGRVPTPHARVEPSQFPLLLTADAITLQTVQAQLAQPDPRHRSVRSLLAALPATHVTVLAGEPAQLRNLNSPADMDAGLLTLNHSLLEHVLS